MPTTRSISKVRSNAVGAGCGVVFLGIFGLVFGGVGLVAAYAGSGRPLFRVYSAQHWQPAQCEIVSSQVTSTGQTSRVDIKYRYTWNDRIYNGAHYDFVTGSDNINDEAKAEVVGSHHPGQVVACFIDPDDPTQSVIDREFKWKYLIGLGFGVPFALVPVLFIGLFLFARRKMKRAQATIVPGGTTPVTDGSMSFSGMSVRSGSGTASASFPAGSLISASSPPPSGPLVLKPESSRFGRLLGMIALCLFWNGLVGLFTFLELTGRVGNAGWFLTLFLIPFQLIGLTLLWAVIRSALTLLNPKPTLTLSDGSVPVGGSMTLQWQMNGATGRLRNLKITLSGREEAHYRRGTSSYTDQNTFYEVQILETSESSRIERGMITVTIPRNTMHSFKASDNRIIWSLKVTGDIGFWPDVDETFDILVRPR
jgi:hypothetical protein